MSDDQDDKNAVPVVIYRVSELEKSDAKQWDHIKDHKEILSEWVTVFKVLKVGLGILVTVVLAVVIYMRGGLDALLRFLAG